MLSLKGISSSLLSGMFESPISQEPIEDQERPGENSFDDLFDVEFHVIDKHGDILGVVRAHKLLLSFLSSVFRIQFKKSSQEKVEVVRIKGPSFKCYKTFLELLYSGDTELTKRLTSLEDLFQMYLLVDKYKVREINQMTKSLILGVPISRDNLVCIFHAIRKYQKEDPLKEICAALTDRCMEVFDEVTKSTSDVRQFLHKILDFNYEQSKIRCFYDGETSLPESTPILVPLKVCLNCGLADCLDGQEVVEARRGVRVTANRRIRSAQGWVVASGMKGVVADYHLQLKKKRCNFFNNIFYTKIAVRWAGDAVPLFHQSAHNITYRCK